MSVMANEVKNLLDMLGSFDRGTGPWTNVAEQIIERVEPLVDSGELEVLTSGGQGYVLNGLSPAARAAFEYAEEQCATFGMEIVGPVIGYDDEREEVLAVVQEALRKWREQKDGTLPPAVEVGEEDEAAPEGEVSAT